jgi:hypothetical protein
MLAEIAAFNLAVATVKEAANHTGDIIQIFKGMGELMSAKEKAEKHVQKKGQSDLEAYAAHAKMQSEYDRIVELLKWTGHWQPYLEFKRQRRKEREEAERQALRERLAKRKKWREALVIFGIVLAGLCAVGILVGLIFLIKTKGRFA